MVSQIIKSLGRRIKFLGSVISKMLIRINIREQIPPKIIETGKLDTPNSQIYDCSYSWFDAGISLKCGRSNENVDIKFGAHVSRITFIRYAQHQMIGKSNNVDFWEQ
jgi:hypothetical protein